MTAAQKRNIQVLTAQELSTHDFSTDTDEEENEKEPDEDTDENDGWITNMR